jgi:hypothetical protein
MWFVTYMLQLFSSGACKTAVPLVCLNASY